MTRRGPAVAIRPDEPAANAATMDLLGNSVLPANLRQLWSISELAYLEFPAGWWAARRRCRQAT